MKNYINLLTIACLTIIGLLILVNMFQYSITALLMIFAVILIGILSLYLKSEKVSHLMENLEHLFMILLFIGILYLGYTMYFKGWFYG